MICSDIAYINEEIVVKTFVPGWQHIDGKSFQAPDHIRSRYIGNILPLSDNEIFYKYLVSELNQLVYEKIIDGEKSAFSFRSSFSQNLFDPEYQIK